MSSFARGDRIVIARGLSKGRRGAIVERWHNFDAKTPQFRVKIDGELGERVIRADFLEHEQRAVS